MFCLYLLLRSHERLGGPEQLAREKRLLAEWMDLGGQYFNDPFDAAANDYDAPRRWLIPCFEPLYGAAIELIALLGAEVIVRQI